jgi:hypothetical protein
VLPLRLTKNWVCNLLNHNWISKLLVAMPISLSVKIQGKLLIWLVMEVAQISLARSWASLSLDKEYLSNLLLFIKALS